MIELSEMQEVARKRVCLAVDVSTVDEALALAEELADVVGSYKIGKGLHIAANNEGIPIVQRLFEMSRGKGGAFLDLKIHDTPDQVYGASKASAVEGVCMFNVHIAGGEAMCRKAVQGADDGAALRGVTRPHVIGVTVLTSLADEDLQAQKLGISYSDLVRRRTELAREWGLDGIVCPARLAGKLESEFGSDFIYVTPGIKWAGVQNQGQKQLYTPDQAVADCSSSILVIGSAITKAEDKAKAAGEILNAMADNLK